MVFSSSQDCGYDVDNDNKRYNKGLDLGTLHQTLPESLWHRHESRPRAKSYKPSKEVGRYKSSLSNLLPVRKQCTKEQMPLDHANFLSYITFTWVGRFIDLAQKKRLEQEDIPLCSVKDGCDHSGQRIEFMWNEELLRKGFENASLRRVAWRFVRTRVLVGIFVYFLSLVCGFIGPVIFVQKLIAFCQDDQSPWWHGAIWASGIAISEIARVLLFGVAWGLANRTGARIKSAIMTMLYRKLMRLSNLGDKSIGEVINLFSNDCQRIYNICSMGAQIFGGPFVAIVATVYTTLVLGPHALLGMLVFILYYPIQYGVSLLTGYFRRKTVIVTDQRVTLMKELLTCIKLIKMYAWEKPFSNRIFDIRRKEQKLQEMGAYVQSASIALTPVVPVVAVIATFLIHIAFGYDLSPAEAFAIISVMTARVRPSLNIAREALKAWDEANVVWPRIESLLNMDQVKPYYQKPMDRNLAVCVSYATFAWHFTAGTTKKTKRKRHMTQPDSNGPQLLPVKSQSCLINIDLLVAKKRLVAICGAVGAGKSSLLSAILGRMKVEQGRILIDGSFAYVSQQAWIMNSTLKENVLFGESFDSMKYDNVISACALNQDLEVLPARDDTEIGERGINLSGGQRQRVAMARALYADKDIYLLDDPLSAVDGHVGQHIFEKCIRGALKDKTVLFVTHQLQYLSQCDEVVVMDQGKVLDQGRHVDLMNRNEFYTLLINTFHQEKNTETKVDEISTIQPLHSGVRKGSITSRQEKLTPDLVKANGFDLPKNSAVNNGRLTEAEKLESGSLPWNTYHLYIQSAGGYIVSFFVLIIFFLNICSTALSSWWLSYWLNNGVANATRIVGNETEFYLSIRTHPNLFFYQMIYGAFILLILLSSVLRSIVFMKACLGASSKLHDQLFTKFFACPMNFFDSTPIGRIINIFSRDLDEIDTRIPPSADTLVQNILIVIMSIVLVVTAVPWFLIALAGLVIIFGIYSRMFRRSLRDLTRLEHVTRSPIYSHIDASIHGLTTVHAFDKQNHFISKYIILQDENTSAHFLLSCTHRWLSVRLEFITVCGMAITAGLIVGLRGVIPAATAGLALAYASQLAGIMQQVVRLACETESRFTSVQRMQTHLKTLESEGPPIVKDKRPPADWPREGSIEFSRVQMRYRPNLPLVLNDISFQIQPREKIGIVGRTGSGKSSLGVCLFRLVDLTCGLIKIDGINIAGIGLEDLRSKLSIIPQDPVLFIGTIRYNLDPFEKYSDEAIWQALERTNMKEKIKSLPSQLESAVIENGENFSVGERQLLCMARAFLRYSKILLLDEATAAIDTQTDALIQQTLRDAFQECTILTIAHRLNTVAQSDRIIVLQDGKIIEFDKPSVLMAKADSVFAGMMSVAETSNDFL